MAGSTKPREDFVEANGLRFRIREWGDTRTKHAVLLLHGYAETSEIWLDVGPDLGREFRVIALDLRGHGQSSYATNQDYSRTAQVEDLEAIVEQLGLRSVTLVGHAMGGADAICYAAEHPESVSALVLVETAPEVLRSGMEALRRLVGTADQFGSLEEAIEAFRPFYPYATTEQLERRALGALKSNNGAYVWDFDPVFRDATARPIEPDPGQRRFHDLWECADRLQCPMMIVRGAETDMLTPEAIQRLHRRVVGSRVSLIEEAGHPVPTDQPSMLALNIREFLQSIANLPV
ncbi:MAG: alpha/beta hydrolase [Chloroflexi bacterium]|nr:alpha/beta hydrolase [Chloroflexota bacterium]MDA1146234.1 alpha/beta hydrolase [Chloroflexota bacterium]